jgi:hypothetical protein
MSVEGYHELDKISKSQVKPIRLPHRRIFPSKKYDALTQIGKKSSKFKTIDLHEHA